MTTPKQSTVVLQLWEESERGWGVRPDGFTLHLTMEDHKRFVADFWKRQKEVCGEETPDEYTRTCGDPKSITVGPETFNRLVAAQSDHGIWYQNDTSPNNLP